jgi:hypothetical protein
MSKNRDLVDIVGQSANTGEALVAQSDGSFDFSEPSVDFTALSGYTISANADPATDTNPSAAGALWLNQNTNQLYICTDATTDANVWLVITLDEDPVSYTFQGSNYGYSAGGAPTPRYTAIERWPFSSFITADDVGDLAVGVYYNAGNNSLTDGYTSGGFSPTVPGTTNTIQKFSFANPSSGGSDVADLATAVERVCGQSSSTDGYTSGSYPTPIVGIIQKFPFASDFSGTASNIGGLLANASRYGPAGQSSSNYGYVSGGYDPGYRTDVYRFSFSSDGDATNIGDLTTGRRYLTGHSSSTDGFTSGGTGPTIATIQKFPFASDWNGTSANVGNLTQATYGSAGVSETSNGYNAGGFTTAYITTIQTWPFAISSGTATDVGDLSYQTRYNAGIQN